MHDRDNELDPQLLRLFAAAEEPSAGETFNAALLLKIERARRIRLWRQLFAAAAVLFLVLLNLRWVLENTAALVRMVGDLAPISTRWLITPWGWAASLVLGAWLLRRFRPSRR